MIQYQSACELAHLFPQEISKFLDLERKVRLGRFREETATDLLLASLARLPGVPLELITPNESQTGSDLDIVIVDLDDGLQVGYRLQAKRLSLTAKRWANHSFRELAHPKNTGGQYQSLTNAASLAGPPTLTPLYAFYTPHSVCAASGSIQGIQLADAYIVGAAIQDVLAKQAAGKRSTAKRIGQLSRHFFNLTELLCPPVGTASFRGIATPAESAEKVSAALRLTSGHPIDPAQRSLPEPSALPASEVDRLTEIHNRGADRPFSVRRRDIGNENPPLIVLDGTPR